MPLITLPDPQIMSAEHRAVHDRIVSGPRGKIQGPLRAALHHAELADKWPNITQIGERSADAAEWDGKPNKLALLER